MGAIMQAGAGELLEPVLHSGLPGLKVGNVIFPRANPPGVASLRAAPGEQRGDAT